MSSWARLDPPHRRWVLAKLCSLRAHVERCEASAGQAVVPVSLDWGRRLEAVDAAVRVLEDPIGAIVAHIMGQSGLDIPGPNAVHQASMGQQRAIPLRLEESTIERLDELASELGTSRAMLMREMINNALGMPVAESAVSESFKSIYADVRQAFESELSDMLKRISDRLGVED